MDTRNIGIFAHVDAGKTTLSEQLLVHAGALRVAGSVDKGTARTDDLPVERRRGISVKATSVEMKWKGTSIVLIDTPGHTDFSAEIERSMWALDAAILIVDACQGVQAQTETLYRALTDQAVPFLIYLNKMDRPGADADMAMSQIRRRLTGDIVPLWDRTALAEEISARDDALTEKYLSDTLTDDEIERSLTQLSRSGRLHPVLKGSALRDQGIEDVLDAIVSYLPAPDRREKALCGIAFAAAHDDVMGRGLWVRLYGGTLQNRQALTLDDHRDPLTGEMVSVQRKITQIRDVSGRDRGDLTAGDVGVVYGLGALPIGHVFGDEGLLPRAIRPGTLRTPLITVRVTPESPDKMHGLREACQILSSEDPLLRAEYVKTTDELQMSVMGVVQIEVLEELLATRFGLKAHFGEPRVIYKETVAQPTVGYVAYTMPKPCWAIMEFDIRPAPRGSGVRFRSTVADRDILPRYQHQVEQAIPQALKQGRLGWEVTDVDITLTGGSHHQWHTHPLDFVVATPMGIQDGLRRGGSVLLEPILDARFVMPAEHLGRVMSDVQTMRGEVYDTESGDDTVTLMAYIPVSESMDYPTTFASLTSGRGSMSTRLHGYRDCPLTLGQTAPRRGVDPLDTSKYILAARSALDGGIFD